MFKSKFIDQYMNIFIVTLIQIFFVFSTWRLLFLVCWIRTAYVLILCSEPAYSLGKRAGLFCHAHCMLCEGGSFAMLSVWRVKHVLLLYVLMGQLFMVYLTQGISLSAPWLFFTQSVGDFTFLKYEISRFLNNKCQLIIKCHNLILYVISSYMIGDVVYLLSCQHFFCPSTL